MAVYLINILSLIVWQKIYESRKYPNTKKIVLIGIFLQFILIEGLRAFSVGVDTRVYMEYYNTLKKMNPGFIELLINPPMSFEPGYLLLMKICGMIGLNDRMFLIVVTLILNILIFRFIYKKSVDPVLSIWLFICTEYFTLSFTMLRQMIAIGIVMNAYLYVEEKKVKPFIGTIILACLFHKTAICFLPIYFILNKEEYINEKLSLKIDSIYNRYKLPIWCSGTVIVILLIPVAFQIFYRIFYPNYNLEDQAFNFPTLAVLMFGILILSYIFEKFFGICDKNFIGLQFCLLCAFLLQVCTFKYLYLFRIALYFFVFVIILIPDMVKYITNLKIKRGFIIIIMVTSFFQYVLFSMGQYNLIPYVLG